MSLQELQNFLFETDRVQEDNMYVTSGVNHYQLNDFNNFNYSTGWLNFNGVQLVGNRAERVLQLNQSYLTVPFGCTVKMANGTFGEIDANGVTTFNRQNVHAIAPEAYHHIFHSIKQSFGGKVIMQGTDHANFYINEKVTAMNSDQLRMLGDIANISWDSATSYRIDEDLLEFNNCTSYADLLTPYGHNFNEGHIKRLTRCNRDLVQGINKTGLFIDNASIFNSTTVPDVFESGLIGVFQGTTKLEYSATDEIESEANKNIDTLVFQFVATVPLCLLSEFYEKIPSIVCMNNMDLKILTNLSPNNSWKVTYGGVGTDKFYLVTKVESSQSVEATCPFLLSEATSPTNAYIPGLMFSEDGGGGDFTITVTPYIGYFTPDSVKVTATGKIDGVPNMFPASIRIPTVAYSSALRAEIAQSSKQLMLFNDFLSDIQIANRQGGSTVQHQLTFSAGRRRKLYILPFFHADPTKKHNAVDPRQSLVSSAGNTTSLCKLTDFKVSVASVNVFDEAQAYTNSYYIESAYITQGKINGNAFISDFVSRQIKYSDYKTCYNSYVVDLERAINESDDDLISNIQLSFKIDMRSDMYYDFLILSEYQTCCYLDRVNGVTIW
jgi:hypothetical protein